MTLEMLTPLLKERFGDRLQVERGRLSLPTEPALVIRAAHPDVGDVVISDNGDEVILSIGSISHEHFNPYDPALSKEAAAAWLADRVATFLDHLLADRVLMWMALRGTAGEWRVVKEPPRRAPRSLLRRWFVWSGPLSP